ncbi:MAG: hypothetical protein WCK27_07545 [Verrucomicrobiota bacterium]
MGSYLHLSIIAFIDLLQSSFQPRQSRLPVAHHPANGLRHSSPKRGCASRLLTRAIPSSLPPFVAPKAYCQSALRPRARRVWRPGLSRPGVRPARAFPWRLARAPTFLSASLDAPIHPADKNVRAPSGASVKVALGVSHAQSGTHGGHAAQPEMPSSLASGVTSRVASPSK